MKDNIVIIIVGLAVVALAAFLIVKTYNNLVVARNKVKDQWSQIDINLKRRADLIPNLVEVVKGYAAHEKTTLEAVISARNQFANAENQEAEIAANQQITGAITKLLVLVEAYPAIKADANFIDLQKNLRETEDKIAFSRQFYNDTVYLYRNKLEIFPASIIGKLFGFKPVDFFEAKAEDRENVAIKL